MQQVVGQQQFRLVVDLLEEERHRRVQGVALSGQQQPVKLPLLIPGQLQVDDRLFLQPRQVDMLGVFEDFGRRLAFGVAQDPVAVVEVAVQFHEPDGDQPVEPRIGHRLHDRLEASLLDMPFQTFAFFRHMAGKGLTADQCHVALFGDRLNMLLGQAVVCRPVCNGCDEVTACLRSVLFQLVAIHNHGILQMTRKEQQSYLTMRSYSSFG